MLETSLMICKYDIVHNDCKVASNDKVEPFHVCLIQYVRKVVGIRPLDFDP